MPAQKAGSSPSFIRHVAPLAPVALALAMQTANQGGHHQGVGSFTPVCPLPFAGVRNEAFDDQCGIDGGSSDPAKQAESQAKNTFCATTLTPRAITYQELVNCQSQSASVPKSLPDRKMIQQLGEGQCVTCGPFINAAH